MTKEVIKNATILILSEQGFYTTKADVHFIGNNIMKAFINGKEIDYRIDWQYCDI